MFKPNFVEIQSKIQKLLSGGYFPTTMRQERWTDRQTDDERWPHFSALQASYYKAIVNSLMTANENKSQYQEIIVTDRQHRKRWTDRQMNWCAHSHPCRKATGCLLWIFGKKTGAVIMKPCCNIKPTTGQHLPLGNIYQRSLSAEWLPDGAGMHTSDWTSYRFMPCW